MAESKRRPRKLKGAVLIMVVTMLFVLVVMLLATLTVVSNANRRTITKYEENQAYYTARSALEVYINEMLEDQDYTLSGSKSSQGGKIIDAWEDAGFVFDTDADALKTNLTNGKDFSGNDDISNGFVHQQKVFCYLTPKYQAQVVTTSGDAREGMLESIDPKAEENWDERPTSSSYKLEDSYMEYTALLPNTSSTIAGDNHLGKLADDNDNDNKGEVNIKIELLRMVYMDEDGKVLYDGEIVTTDPDDLDGGKIKVSKIDWTQCYYRLKVTATTSISDSTGGNNESTISVLLEPNTKVTPASFTNAMTSFAGTTNANKANVVGGASANNPTEVFTNQNTPSIYSGRFVYAYRGIKIENSSNWEFSEGGYYVNRQGWLYFNNAEPGYVVGSGDYNTTDSDKRDNRPFIYSAGLGTGNKLYIGSADKACDIILANNGSFTSSPETSGLSNSVSPNVVFVSGQNGTRIYGDMYVDGDMYLKGSVEIYGTIYCTGNVYIVNGASITLDHDAQIAGSVLYTDGTEYKDDKVFAHLISGGGCSITAGSLVMPTTDVPVDLTLPGRSSPVTIESTVSETEGYRDKNDGHVLSAVEMLRQSVQNENIELTVGSTAISMEPSTAVGGEFIPSTANFNSQTGCYEYKLDLTKFQNNNSVYYIDASQGNVHIQLTGYMDSASPIFITRGSNSVVFTIADSDYVSHKGMRIMTEQIYNMILSGDTFEFGDELYYQKLKEQDPVANANKPDTPSSPQIYYFIGSGATFEGRNSNDALICGYLYGPDATFNYNVGSNQQISFTYNDSSVRTMKVSVIGSLVFREIYTNNDFGIAFQPPGGGGNSTDSRSMMTWNRQRYLGR